MRCAAAGSAKPSARAALLVLLLAPALNAAAAVDDDAPPPGMDVLPLVRAAAEALRGRESPLPGRPWSDELAALTGPDPAAAAIAIGRLARLGSAVLPDLAILAGDRDWQIRARIVRVLAGIGGEAAAPLALRLAGDADPRVRRLALMALGRARGEEVFARLAAALQAPDPDERVLAAEALAAFDDPRAMPLLADLAADPDAPARAARAEALRRLAARPHAAATVIRMLAEERGGRRRALLEAMAGHRDPRLSPALAGVLASREALEVLLACRALETAGDARAVPALVELAASERLPQLCEAAAATLRRLTGYPAGPGKAWLLWWQEQEARWRRLAERDALIAALAEPDGPLPELAAFGVDELAPLIELACERRPSVPWLPARALAALRRDAGARWAEALEARLEEEAEAARRLELLLLLDEIGGAAAGPALRRQLARADAREAEALTRWRERGVLPPDFRAERALIRLALERR